MKFIARVYSSGPKKLVTVPKKLEDIKIGDYVVVIPDKDLCAEKYQIVDSPKPYKPFSDEEEEEEETETEPKPTQKDENLLGKEGLEAAAADKYSNTMGHQGVQVPAPSKPKVTPTNRKPIFLGGGR